MEDHRTRRITVQYMSSDTTRQLVADHRAALHATIGRGRLRRMLDRTADIDLTALESVEIATPAVVVAAGSTAPATVEHGIDKVA
jgi:hypothetical protein